MILLGFDVEEFDMPFEYGKTISFEEQLSISTNGTQIILEILRGANIKATIFCTANFAINRPDIIRQIISDGHELASHGYYHSDFKPEHLAQSKEVLQSISGTVVTGFRMARMMAVEESEIAAAGYTYNSSINPTWIPGRYNNFKQPRKWFYRSKVLQLPASVSPLIRFPLFWLSFHVLPFGLIKWISRITHKKDGYLNLYFHPWEFVNIKDDRYGVPQYVANTSGIAFAEKIKAYIKWAQGKGYQFARTGDFVTSIPKE